MKPSELHPWEGFRFGSPARLREAIKARRLELGLSMEQAAEECGITFAAYRASEETLTCFSPERIWSLAWGLGVTPQLLAAVAGYPTVFKWGGIGLDWGEQPDSVLRIFKRNPE